MKKLKIELPEANSLKRILSKLALILAVLFSATLLILFLTRTTFVAIKIPSTSGMIRPRNYCWLNPFRNRAAEQLAESYLLKLRERNIDAITPFVGANSYILDNERKWPIREWRIGDLKNQNCRIEILYWVTRGNGYELEEEVHFVIEETPQSLKLQTYSAIY